jgi:hypothetical protein
MSIRSLLLAVLFVSAISARAALDLSPFPSEFDGEGIKYTQLSFKDGQRRVSYVPPQKWTWRGGSAQLHLLPPATFLRASAVIETAPLAAPQSLDEKTIAALRQEFLNTLPPGAVGAKIVSEEQGPLQLGGNIPTYEFTATYQALGEIYVHSTLFANLPEAQLRFKFTSVKRDFDSLHRTFRASLISWEWQEPATSSAERLTASK